jgi:hypothetical protein
MRPLQKKSGEPFFFTFFFFFYFPSFFFLLPQSLLGKKRPARAAPVHVTCPEAGMSQSRRVRHG